MVSFQSQAQSTSASNDIIQGIDVNFFADGRLRYQTLDQDNLEVKGEALTLGIKAGAEFEVADLFSALIEIDGNEQLIDDFNDTTNGRFDAPVIIDVPGIELNRLQLQTELIPRTRLTLGRQSFALDNWRFLGKWQFRQNDQTLDAIRAESTFGQGRLNLGYFNKVHRHFGDNSPVGEFSGDSFVVNFSHPAPLGQLSVFHYALDLQTGNVEQPIDTLSSQTTGIRWHGRRHWDDFGLGWDISFARQSDYADNPDTYDALYQDFGLDLQYKKVELELGLEILGSDNGVALQTPLGSLHGFQGVTDRFFRTPVDGLKDYHTALKFNLGDIGPFERVQARAGYHEFTSEKNKRDFGRELNIGVNAKVNDISLSMELGNFATRASQTDSGFLESDAKTAIFSVSYSFD